VPASSGYKDSMRRSAIRASLAVVALLFVSACGPPEPQTASEKAHDAWKLYLGKPDPNTYENFIRANRAAADQHGLPHDAVGVEYQLRALEVMAAEAERTGDLRMAEDVSERVLEIEQHELVDVYEDALPGPRERLDAAKVRSGRGSR
jgi:hypothetical protein